MSKNSSIEWASCPKCGSTDITLTHDRKFTVTVNTEFGPVQASGKADVWNCQDCGAVFREPKLEKDVA